MSIKGADQNRHRDDRRKRFMRFWAFPIVVIIIYGMIAIVRPEQTTAALKSSGAMLLQVTPALVVAFAVMFLLNLWIKPDHIKRFMGKGKKVRGTLLSSIAGILSTGPIYAWYPLLRNFRDKGMSDFHLALFLGCRAVKIPLMPLMAAYFGWSFTLILNMMIVLAAMLTGVTVSGFNSILFRRVET